MGCLTQLLLVVVLAIAVHYASTLDLSSTFLDVRATFKCSEDRQHITVCPTLANYNMPKRPDERQVVSGLVKSSDIHKVLTGNALSLRLPPSEVLVLQKFGVPHGPEMVVFL